MNVPAADPAWGWWIIWYFFLGGTAAGSYFLATLAELFGTEQDRRNTRGGYLIAAPLMAVCGILLIADLNKPMRFWHMLLDHDRWFPHLNFWSPMSIGAWAILLFSVISVISCVGVLAQLGKAGLARFQSLAVKIHHGFWGRSFDLVGVTSGFFIASYTGVLLTATNQPVWSDSPWIGALFLASSSGTGIAAIKLIEAITDPQSQESMSLTHSALDSIEPWTWTLEVIAAGLFLYSLDVTTRQMLVRSSLAIPFFGGAIGLGILLPILLRWLPRRWAKQATMIGAIAVLVGGFLLRYSVLMAPNVIRSG